MNVITADITFAFPFPRLDVCGTLSSSLMLSEDVLISGEETSKESELSQSSSLEDSSAIVVIFTVNIEITDV